jgi:hypothetical protein
MIGRVVVDVETEADTVRLFFDNGLRVSFVAVWCNDSTADLEIEIERKNADQPEQVEGEQVGQKAKYRKAIERFQGLPSEQVEGERCIGKFDGRVGAEQADQPEQVMWQYRVAERERGRAFAVEYRASDHETWDTLPFRFLSRIEADAKLAELRGADQPEQVIPVYPNRWIYSGDPRIGYIAGWSQHYEYGPMKAWGLTPRSARRRWQRKWRRMERKLRRVDR